MRKSSASDEVFAVRVLDVVTDERAGCKEISVVEIAQVDESDLCCTRQCLASKMPRETRFQVKNL